MNLLKRQIRFSGKILIEYYTENQKYFQTISKRHSTRKKIFEQIEKIWVEFYYLAIPIIFSQIDGICYDLTSKKIIYLRFIQKWRNFRME
jgi:hypothetical protein